MRRWLPALSVLLLALGGTGVASAQNDVATVTVLHGLPGFTADVYVNGKLTLNGFRPEEATDPLELPAGDYHIDIRDVGAAADSSPVLSGTATVQPGQNLSIIAGLTESGDLTLNVYTNSQKPVPAGKTRLVVRHQAATTPLDVKVDGKTVHTGLANGDDVSELVAAGKHTIQFTDARADSGAIDPLDVNLKEGTEQILYVVGSAENQSLDVMSQVISDMQTDPSDILAGDGGLASEGGLPLPALALMVTSMLIMVASAGWLGWSWRRRRLATDRHP
jgi:hypothetical protein